MTRIIRILRDFKPILNLDLYGEHMPEERITGSNIDLDLSAGSVYTQAYTVIISFWNYTRRNTIKTITLEP